MSRRANRMEVAVTHWSLRITHAMHLIKDVHIVYLCACGRVCEGDNRQKDAKLEYVQDSQCSCTRQL